MLEIFGKAIISFIEKELVNAEPEIEALVIAQLEKLGSVIMSYVQGKLDPAAALAAPKADDIQPAVGE